MFAVQIPSIFASSSAAELLQRRHQENARSARRMLVISLMPSFRPLPALTLTLALFTSCDRPRPISTPGSPALRLVIACTGCHGDPERVETDPLVNSAPPVSPSGSATSPGVGAHLAHLHAGPFRGAMACAECHVVPTSPMHGNGKVEVIFSGGDLAIRNGAAPVFTPATASCATTYCHGSTLNAGGTNQTPTWNGGPAEAACGTCHGNPPPSHAATSTTCSTCHPQTVKADGTIDLAGGFHINGSVEVLGGHPTGWADPTQHGHAANSQGLSGCRTCHGANLDGGTAGVSCATCHTAGWQSDCTFCHGTPTAGWTSAQLVLAAPPLGTQGQTATTDRAVGAHARHLAGGSIGAALACAECHTVPADLTHIDGTPAVTFGAAARRGGAAPAWSGVGCSATYCHGGTLTGGGSNKAPTWTGGSAQAACGTCHGTPPSTGRHGDHSGRSCGDCHPGFTRTTVDLPTHIDGLVQVGNQVTAWNATTGACTGCHGNATW
jgi:predicted CxxxxCH...CXXCH cytochrome family protein